jgi:hypothetical protein
LAPVRVLRRNIGDWTYVPRYVVRTDFLLGALFVGPARRHYHFGDHFTADDVKRGFVAWFDYRPTTTKHSYDPIYNHYRLAFFDDPAWDRNLRELYRTRFAGEIARPPHTIVHQQQLLAELIDKKTGHANLIKEVNFTLEESVTALMPLAKDKVHEERVTRLSGLAPHAKLEPAHIIKTHQLKNEERGGEREQIQHSQRVAQARSEYEAKLLEAGTVHSRPAGQPKVAPFVVPKSPAVRPTHTVKPPLPVAPKHQERPVPAFRPPPPPMPPHRLHK